MDILQPLNHLICQHKHRFQGEPVFILFLEFIQVLTKEIHRHGVVGINHLFAFNSFDLVYHVPIVDFWEANKICHPIVQFFQDPELVIYEYPYIGSSFDFYCNFDLASLVKC